MRAPNPFLEWVITDACNYSCSYCFQRNYATEGHCSDETVDAVMALISRLQGNWQVKLIGGEPFIHPRFFEMCQRIVSAGFRICTTTNLSLPTRRLQGLIDACGGGLAYVGASLHLSQVKSVDGFIERAAEFNARKDPTTHFSVLTVMLEEEFDRLREIERRLGEKGVKLGWQILRVNGEYVKYSDEIEHYLTGKIPKAMEKARGMNVFGTLCHAGHLLFKIDVNGDVVRCYNPQPLYFLGNVQRGTVKLFNEARPCTSRRCTCRTPADQNMILYGRKAGYMTVGKAVVQGTPASLRYVAAKVACIVRRRRAKRSRCRTLHKRSRS